MSMIETCGWKGVVRDLPDFIYGVDQHCHTMVGCNLTAEAAARAALKEEMLWAPTWQKEWAKHLRRANRCR